MEDRFVYGPNWIRAGFRTDIIITVSYLSFGAGRKRIRSIRSLVSDKLFEIAVVGKGEAL